MPMTPWEATALIANTGIAAGVPNTAKLDRLTYLESVVANLLLGQPATLGLHALPAVKAVTITLGQRLDGIEPGDLTGAQFVALTVTETSDDTLRTAFVASVRTPTAAALVAETPHVVPGDAWLVLVANASTRPLSLEPAHGVRGTVDVLIPPGAAQLFLVSVASLAMVVFTPLLFGALSPAFAATFANPLANPVANP